MTDQELVESILNENKDQFQELLNRYQRMIFAYLLRLLNFHREDAEDVLSNTFLKVYINLASYNPKMKFSSWLYRIAHNEAVNYIRKKSKHFTTDIEKVELGVEIDFDKPNKSDIEKVLSRLKEEERNILILFYIEERSIREIGDILKISDGNVKVRLNRARNKAKEFTN